MDNHEVIRIGILGAAKIGKTALLKPAAAHPLVTVQAIAARDETRAHRYASKHGIPQVHATYEDLLNSSDIDAVYIPLPNGLHAQWSQAALQAGKHVLCEKPITANGDEARAVQAVANQTGLVAMEALHYRFHPYLDRLDEPGATPCHRWWRLGHRRRAADHHRRALPTPRPVHR